MFDAEGAAVTPGESTFDLQLPTDVRQKHEL